MSVSKIKKNVTQDFKTLNLNTWEKQQTSNNKLNQINTTNSTEILDLGKGPINTESYNTNVNKIKHNFLDSDKYILDLIANNPNLEYIGTELHEVIGHGKIDKSQAKKDGIDPMVEHSIEFNSYKIYDKENNVTFYIQRGCDEQKVKATFDTIEKMSKKSKTLLANINEIAITDMPCPSNAYWTAVQKPDNWDEKTMGEYKFGAAAIGGFGIISIFSDCDYSHISSTIYHEGGHSLDGPSFQISNSSEWYDAMVKDGRFVSIYAEESFYNRNADRCAEDFADSVKLLEEYGIEEFKFYFPNRAIILEQYLPEYFN